MEYRVYGIDSYKLTDSVELTKLVAGSLTDEEYIEISESHGNVWTLKDFERAYNYDRIKSSIFIRFIKVPSVFI